MRRRKCWRQNAGLETTATQDLFPKEQQQPAGYFDAFLTLGNITVGAGSIGGTSAGVGLGIGGAAVGASTGAGLGSGIRAG